MSLSPLGDKPMPLSQRGSTHDTVTLKWPGIKEFKRHKMQTRHWSNPYSSCTSLCCMTWHVLRFYSKLLFVTKWKACLLEMAVLFMHMPTWCALHWKTKNEKKSRMNEMQSLRKNIQITQIHLHAKIPILIFFFLKDTCPQGYGTQWNSGLPAKWAICLASTVNWPWVPMFA